MVTGVRAHDVPPSGVGTRQDGRRQQATLETVEHRCSTGGHRHATPFAANVLSLQSLVCIVSNTLRGPGMPEVRSNPGG